MSKFLHQRQNYTSLKPHLSLLTKPQNLLLLFSLLVVVGFLLPYSGNPSFSFVSDPRLSKWQRYSLHDAVSFVARAGNGTVIVCIVSEPYLPFLNNWLISVARHGHQDKVLVIAEDYGTLLRVNDRWPGHAVVIPPVLDLQSAHKFGSQVKPLNHSHGLPPPGKKGRPYICSCMILLRPTDGAKLVLRSWIQEMQEQPWTKARKSNDQPAFNWALMKTEKQVDMYLLPQYAFPTGGLYFKNKTWVKENKGKQVIIHNNYILGFEKKIKRFHDYDLWLVDHHSDESPLGKL